MDSKLKTIRIPTDLDSKIELINKKLGLSASELIREGIVRYVLLNKEFNELDSLSVENNSDFKRSNLRIAYQLAELVETQATALNTSFNSLVIFALYENAQYYLKVIEELNL